MKTRSAPEATIRLVVFDWAGTVVDHGSVAPVAALMLAFGKLGLDLSESDARGPMGLHKRDHIARVLESPSIIEQWKKSFGQPPTRADGDALYERFLPLQETEALKRTALVPGVLDCCAELRKRSISVGTTTGYPRSIGEPIASLARSQGFLPDHCVFADDVPAGRPMPWMIFRIMEVTRVAPPSVVVKIGDTVPDIEEGRNAGTWCIGVTETGSEIGVNLEQWRALPASERLKRSQSAGETLLRAGAHAVVPSVAALPALIDELNLRLGRGDGP